MKFRKKVSFLLVLVLCLCFSLSPSTAYTTQVTVTRMSADGITPTDSVATLTYQQMEAGLPVMGDGNSYYYFQGPVFEEEWEANYGVSYPEYRDDWVGTPPVWEASEERWDRFWNGGRYVQNEEINWQTKNLGKLKGSNVKDLVDLVGGLPAGRIVRVIAEDNAYQDLPYAAIYNPVPQLGPYVITWWSEGAGESGDTRGYTGPDYTNGMRATFFADTSGNPSGEHVAGLGDQAAGLPADYWYYYSGAYPSTGGWTLKYINRIHVYSNDPVPPPVAGFTANIRTGRIVNGNFENGLLSPWSGSGTTVSAYAQRRGVYSLRLQAPPNGNAWARQSIDLTDVGTLRFWRHQYGGPSKYLQVLVDDMIVANYTETVTVPNRYETIDLSGYSFSGTHDLTFRSVSGTGTLLTVYLDDIEDYSPGTSGKSPLTIQFSDISAKMEDTSHTSWAWDFDSNGVIDSAERNPQYTYTTPGSYTVRLTATNAGGSDSDIRTGYIVVNAGNAAPVAQAQSVSTDENIGLPITLTATDADGDTLSYAIINNPLHGSLTGTLPALTYTPAAGYSGSDSFTFQANDGSMDSNIAAISITVNAVNAAPVALAQSVSTNENSAVPILLMATDADGDTLMYRIVNNPRHGSLTGTAPGMTYTPAAGFSGSDSFTFVVNDGSVDSNFATVSITVNQGIAVPAAEFTAAPRTGTIPLLVSFTDASTNTPTSWSWIMEGTENTDYQYVDATSARSQNPRVRFLVAGSYDVGLTATNTAGSDDVAKTNYITVTATPICPVAGFSTLVDSLTVQFTDISTNTPTSWSWNFGDGSTSADRSPTHTYANAGTFMVTLTVSNAAGSDAYSGSVTVTDSAPVAPEADFFGTPTTGTAPLTVQFTDVSANSPTSWKWEYKAEPGDGNRQERCIYGELWTQFSADQNSAFTFQEKGTYTIRLTVKNAAGSDTKIREGYITVLTARKPDARIEVQPASGTVPLTVRFTDKSTNTPTSWKWEYRLVSKLKPGIWTEFATDQNPSFQFTEKGIYSIRLTAKNAAGSDTTIRRASVRVKGIPKPDARFMAEPTAGTAPLTVRFTDISTNTPTSWKWEYRLVSKLKPGIWTEFATDQNPIHQFTEKGMYSILMTAGNAGGSDIMIRRVYIRVTGERPAGRIRLLPGVA